MLVIASNPGWFGDPWDAKKGKRSSRSVWEMLWKSPYEESISDSYKTMIKDHGERFDALTRRESVFLHLGGNLGLALIVLSFALFLSLGFGNRCPFFLLSRSIQVCVAVALLFVGFVFVIGHYWHARSIQLYRRAAVETSELPTVPGAGGEKTQHS